MDGEVRLPGDARTEIVYVVSGSGEDAQERLRTRWSRNEAVVRADQRLEALVADIVAH